MLHLIVTEFPAVTPIIAPQRTPHPSEPISYLTALGVPSRSNYFCLSRSGEVLQLSFNPGSGNWPILIPRKQLIAEYQYEINSRLNTTMDASCQCGNVKFKTPATKPLAVYHCHCTECRKQSGSAFGTSAIFKASPLFPLSSELQQKLYCYTRPTHRGVEKDCYFCPICGVRVFHKNRSSDCSEKEMVSIKGGCIDGLDWSGAQHIYARSAVIPIPTDAKRWETSPEVEEERSTHQSTQD